MTRTLVTGASGFIGQPLTERLASGSGEVHAVSRAAVPPEGLGVHWHRVDLADRHAVRELLEEVRPERLIHLAWYVEHGRFWSAPENEDWVQNSLGLLRAFVASGGHRAVMLGSCAEYDWSAADAPLRELDSPVAPSTLYGQSKDALRRAGEAYAQEAGIEFAWARPFFFYGPRENPARLMPAVIKPLLAGEPVPTTEGSQRRDFMHVDDVAGAIAALLESSVRGAVNIASGEAVAVRDVVAQIAALIGRPELIRAGSLPSRDEPQLLCADVSRLREEVGYSPRWTLAEGLEATVRWWQMEQEAG